MFNRSEKIALLFLCASLIAGGAVSIVDYHDPERLEDFRVAKAAVEIPAAAASISDHREPESAGGTVAAARVDVNTATAAELASLPSIGPATAKRIVDYRTLNGPFTSLKALRQVKGIGPRTVEKLEPLTIVASSQQASF